MINPQSENDRSQRHSPYPPIGGRDGECATLGEGLTKGRQP